MRCSPDHIIKSSPQWEILREPDGDTADIIKAIFFADARSQDFILDGVECLRGETDNETLHNVWAFVRNNIRYRPDPSGHERIKSPGALFAAGVGDCKSFSVAIGAVLRALGYQYRYRFASYSPTSDYSHVYIVANAGGRDWILDSVYKHFNREVDYSRAEDMAPAKSKINGLGAIKLDLSPKMIFGGILLFLLLRKVVKV